MVQRKKNLPKSDRFFCLGTGGRGRTGTVSLPLDFESSTSANSITPAQLTSDFDKILYHRFFDLSNKIFYKFSIKFLFTFNVFHFFHFPIAS